MLSKNIFRICIFCIFLVMGATLAMAQTSRAESAASYYARGVEWQQKGELARALSDFTFALTFDPKLADAWNNRGVIHFLQNDLTRAINDYSKALPGVIEVQHG
jgi:Tfp pilus assembly protein PilF